MRQAVFVSLNEEKWQDFENKLKAVKVLPADELSYMYVHLTEDLAYAKGKYPDSQLAQYLNELTVRVHHHIYRNKPETASRFVTFWKTEVPRELNHAYPYLGYSFLIFIVGALIGALSTANDTAFVR